MHSHRLDQRFTWVREIIQEISQVLTTSWKLFEKEHTTAAIAMYNCPGNPIYAHLSWKPCNTTEPGAARALVDRTPCYRNLQSRYWGAAQLSYLTEQVLRYDSISEEFHESDTSHPAARGFPIISCSTHFITAFIIIQLVSTISPI